VDCFVRCFIVVNYVSGVLIYLTDPGARVLAFIRLEVIAVAMLYCTIGYDQG
jgi:hypothetical protein